MDLIRVSAEDLEEFCLEALESCGVCPDVASHVAEGLVQASLRGVDSHGVRLLPHYLKAVKAGRLNPVPSYRFKQRRAGIGRLDGDHTFGHAAGAEGMMRAIQLARHAGVGAVSVYNSSHYGAAAYFALMAAKEDMIGFSFTHGDSLILSSGGRRPFFGANTCCFAAPCNREDPFCMDMATSVVTWNKILQVRNQGGSIPLGWGVDEEGKDTQDAHRISALHPIGGHKGFALSMMVEILCSLLSGMPFGRHIVRMYADPIREKRSLGHFFMAFDISSFIPLDQFKIRIRELMDEVRSEPPMDSGVPIQVPGDPEKRTNVERRKLGIPLGGIELELLHNLAIQNKLRFPPQLES